MSPNETTPEITATHGFDPIAFWMENKGKVLLYGGLLIAALIACAFYQISTEKAQAAARQAFAEASSADAYRKVAQEYPKSVVAGDARLLLAGQLRDEKKYDEALATLKAFIDGSPEHPLISSAYLSRAETLAASGKIDEALAAFQEITTKFLSSYAAPLAMVERAKLLKKQGKTDEARRAFESVRSQFPESAFEQEVMREMYLLKKK